MSEVEESTRTAPHRVPIDVTAVIGLSTAAVLGLEFLLHSGRVDATLTGYLLAFAASALASLWSYRSVAVLRAVALIAVFRLVNLSMPAFTDLTIYWLPLVYLPVLFAAVIAVHSSSPLELPMMVSDPLDWRSRHGEEGEADEDSAGREGWDEADLLVLGGLLVVAVGIAVVDAVLSPPAMLASEPTALSVVVLSGVVILAAVVEELLFRRLLQTALADWLGTAAGILLASLAFAAMQQPVGVFELSAVYVAGLVFGVAYEYADSLTAPVLFHAIVNVLVFVVLPGSGLTA